MDEANRFAPPGSRVADVADESAGFQPVRLWPPDGRMGRLRLLAYGAGMYILFLVVSSALGIVAGMTQSAQAAFAIGIVTFVLYLVGVTVLMIQRSHDLDLSGWWSIVAFIPLVGLFWLFKGGTPGVNRWGAPPPPNGWGVRILGLIVPVVMVVGIVAAIALPAYVDYTNRGISGAKP
ncbi:MAG: DUF805 domain-containing protein [Caldimonas sp.]